MASLASWSCVRRTVLHGQRIATGAHVHVKACSHFSLYLLHSLLHPLPFLGPRLLALGIDAIEVVDELLQLRSLVLHSPEVSLQSILITL